jgi:hypothetical protein
MGLRHLSFALVLVALAAVASAQRSCTVADYTGEYTECVHGVRNAIYYKKEGVDCVGGVAQPDNVFRVPCGPFPDPTFRFIGPCSSLATAPVSYLTVRLANNFCSSQTSHARQENI